MKGLLEIPNNPQLQNAYHALQSSRSRHTSTKIALWSQWSRLDPRLGESLVLFLAKNWKSFSPIKLQNALLQQPWPAAFGVLVEHVKIILNDRLFYRWSECVMTHISPANHEQFFIGLRSFAGKLMLEDSIFSLDLYLKWGYFSRDILINKFSSLKNPPTLISRSRRTLALKELLSTKKRITVKDYREKLGWAVNIRQAQRDLSAFSGIQSQGQTKSRFYRRTR